MHYARVWQNANAVLYNSQRVNHFQNTVLDVV